jgi:hypothetical protein
VGKHASLNTKYSICIYQARDVWMIYFFNQMIYFPGFRRPLGSNICLICFIIPIAVSSRE